MSDRESIQNETFFPALKALCTAISRNYFDCLCISFLRTRDDGLTVTNFVMVELQVSPYRDQFFLSNLN
jgi:hypothetical protein